MYVVSRQNSDSGQMVGKVTYTLKNYLEDASVLFDLDWADKIKLPFTPMEHQSSGLNLLFQWTRAGLYDEMGCGKTLPVQAYAIVRAAQGNKVVCLMPPALLEQFVESFHSTFIGIEEHITAEVLKGTKAQRDKRIPRYEEEGWPDIVIMSYQLFTGSKRYVGYHDRLKKEGYKTLIADEAHVLRNLNGIHRTVYNWVGGKDTGKAFLVALTGTPMYTHLEQCYGLIRLLTPLRYSNQKAFERQHVLTRRESFRNRLGKDVIFNTVYGYMNEIELTTSLYLQARRVVKEDVADLPAKTNTIVPVELDPAHIRLYKRLLSNRVLKIGDEIIDATQDQALRQIAMRLITNPSEFSDTEIKNNMEETLLQIVDSAGIEHTKLIVFCHFNSTIDRLNDLLADFNPAIMNGMVSNKEAQKTKFLKDETCRILLAHPLSAGAGLNLQSVSSNVVFYECPDSPGAIAQASDRVYRVGTTVPVSVYFLGAKNTWGMRKLRKVVEKDENINNVVRDKKQLLGDLFDA